MTTFALNNLWNYIKGLHLSESNKVWLANKLLHSAGKDAERVIESTDVRNEGLPYEEIPLTPRVKRLRTLYKKVNILPEDIENDERMAYILNK